MECVVDADHRRQSTGTDTGHDFQAEHAVARRLTGFDFQIAADRIEHAAGATHMTSRSAADLDVELALWLEPELVVERCHAIDLARGEFQILADPDHRIARQIAVTALNVLQNGNQRGAFRLRILGKDRVDVRRNHVVHSSVKFRAEVRPHSVRRLNANAVPVR